MKTPLLVAASAAFLLVLGATSFAETASAKRKQKEMPTPTVAGRSRSEDAVNSPELQARRRELGRPADARACIQQVIADCENLYGTSLYKTCLEGGTARCAGY